MDNDILFKIKELDNTIIKLIFKDNNKSYNKRPSRTQLMFIKYLMNHEEGNVTAKELEDNFGITKATVSDVLNTMEKHKMITRVISNDDTRYKKIILNKHVTDEYKSIEKNIIDANIIIKNGIDKNNLDIFNNVINKMINNINVFLEGSDNNDKNA